MGHAQDRRERVLRRDRFRCVYCGAQFPEAELTLDHVQPRLRGGDSSEGNLVACCRGCNTLKGHEPAWSFLAARPVERANFLAAVAACDRSQAQAVWDRHLRAIREAL